MEDRISRSTASATRTLELLNPSSVFLFEFVSFHFRFVCRRFAFFFLFTNIIITTKPHFLSFLVDD
jgi:hypothetical protein